MVATVGAGSPPSAYVDAAGVRTHVHRAGRGRPVVLLHGSGPGVTAWANWSNVFADLAVDHDVIAPEMAGFGFSNPGPGRSPGIKLWVKQLFGLLDALGLKSATLVGNSFGGGLALAATLRDPSRIDGLVLMGTPVGAFTMTEGLRAGWYYEPDIAEMERILRLFPYDPSLVTAEMVRERYETSARPGAQEAYRALIPEPGAEGTEVKGVPEASLRRIEQSTLVLHGREDGVIPLELAWRAASEIPKAELHMFGQCGHWVQLERQAGFLALVRDFVRRLP